MIFIPFSSRQNYNYPRSASPTNFRGQRRRRRSPVPPIPYDFIEYGLEGGDGPWPSERMGMDLEKNCCSETGKWSSFLEINMTILSI